MNSIILRSAMTYLFPLLLLFSVFSLLKGHDEPGGGFIGGLLAATAFAIYALAFEVKDARQLLRVDLEVLLGVGLLCSAAAGIWALLAGAPFLTGLWTTFEVPGLGEIKLGTPILFDLGVYLTVIGVTLMIVFTLAEEEV